MIQGARAIDLPLTGGLDEISAVNKIPLARALKMENGRISRDGKRFEKRLGLAEEVTDFGEDVYGYTTYNNSAGTFCQLAILETKIMRKVGSAAWGSIHSFSSSIAHPVLPLEIQGKQFIITEVDGRMVHTDGNDYQMGITAPATLPTATAAYVTAEMTLSDLMAYANQGAMDAVWTDADTGTGASTLATSGPATQGPDGDAKYMKFAFGAVSSLALAKRTRAIESPGNTFSIETDAFFDAIGTRVAQKGFHIIVWNGTFKTHLALHWGGVEIETSSGWKKLSGKLPRDTWRNWKFTITGSDSANPLIACYRSGVLQAMQTFSKPDTTSSAVHLYAEAVDNSSQQAVVYLDNFKLNGETGATAIISGTRRYAVTYVRGGNYGCESNPIKCLVGSVTFTGAGVNDMTAGGTYTSVATKTIRVQVDGTGTPDTFKWSEDGGATWSSELIPMTATVYLSYGITVSFAATTTHTLGNYWEFTCSVCAASPVDQKVTLTGIPTSSDAQVTQRKLYATTAGGADFYWLATINDNTTTTFTDNIPDIALGTLMEEDHDTVPLGKFSAWWDERLWVSGDSIVYYSQLGFPEHFDISSRYVTVQKGDSSDLITGMVPYKDALYIFRKKSIHVIQKTYDGYGRFLVTSDVGCIAPWSIVLVNNTIMFMSHRGIEMFNGQDVTGLEPSLPIDRTYRSIDRTATDFISAAHFPEKREVWFSVPDLGKTIVYHYLADAWYFFTFYKTPSCLVQCYNSLKTPVMKMGTRDGYLCLCESGYRDNTTAITMTYRKPWIETELIADARRLEVEYEIPATMTLTVNVYVSFRKDPVRTFTTTGETLSATDIELRRPEYNLAELGQRAKYFSVEFTNAENLGGDLKINEAAFYLRERTTKMARKTYGN